MTLLQAFALWWYGVPSTTVAFDRHALVTAERRGQVAGYRRGVRDGRVACLDCVYKGRTTALACAPDRSPWDPAVMVLTMLVDELEYPFPVELG